MEWKNSLKHLWNCEHDSDSFILLDYEESLDIFGPKFEDCIKPAGYFRWLRLTGYFRGSRIINFDEQCYCPKISRKKISKSEI